MAIINIKGVKIVSELYPVRLIPVFKDYLWGGTKLKTVFNKKSELNILAESWELSANKDGQSIIANGKYQGYGLKEYIDIVGKEIVGTKGLALDDFPILIKFIDAKKNLSVQVHPDDEYATCHDGANAKTEMWYILDCNVGAYLYYGFKKDITKQEYQDAIRSNTITDVLNKVPVHKGDVFFIPAGTVHAIGAGILICEIQQNSNTTYRVYDYDRRDKDGNKRELHIREALESSNLKKSTYSNSVLDGDDIILTQCDYFTVRRLKVQNRVQLRIDKTSFHSLIITDGSGELYMGGEILKLNKGDSIFIPAQNNEYTVSGPCEIILSFLSSISKSRNVVNFLEGLDHVRTFTISAYFTLFKILTFHAKRIQDRPVLLISLNP